MIIVDINVEDDLLLGLGSLYTLSTEVLVSGDDGLLVSTLLVLC